MHYFPEQDVIHLAITDEKEMESMELSPTVTAELNAASLAYRVCLGCADEGGASFAIDALRSSAHPTALGVKYAASNRS